MSATDVPRMRHRAVALLLPLSALAACSTGGQRTTTSGFLPSYTQLQKTGEHKNTVLWTAPTYEPARYRNAIVEMPEWHAAPRDADVQARLTADLRSQLIERLGNRYRIVEQGQTNPRTLRVRSAITNVRRTRWYLNAPAQAVGLALGGLVLLPPLQGGASEELQVEDAQTGAVLVQIATYRNGKPWNFKGSYVAFDHARMAFKEAAGRLDDILRAPAVAADS